MGAKKIHLDAKRATFVLSSFHADMLDQLAARDGVTTSDMVRRLITDAYRQSFGLAINHLAHRHAKAAEVAAAAQSTKKAAKKRTSRRPSPR